MSFDTSKETMDHAPWYHQYNSNHFAHSELDHDQTGQTLGQYDNTSIMYGLDYQNYEDSDYSAINLENTTASLPNGYSGIPTTAAQYNPTYTHNPFSLDNNDDNALATSSGHESPFLSSSGHGYSNVIDQTTPATRFKFSAEHGQYLESMYKEDKYPERNARINMAERVGCQEKSIHTWFSRRRAKDKEERGGRDGKSESDKSPMSASQSPQMESPIAANNTESPVSMAIEPPIQFEDHETVDTQDQYMNVQESPTLNPATITMHRPQIPQKMTAASQKDLTALMDDSGGVASAQKMEELIQFMRDQETPGKRSLTLSLILKTRDERILKSFTEAGGFKVLRKWLIEGIKDRSAMFIKRLLETVAYVPMDYDTLLDVKQLPKIIAKVKYLETDDERHTANVKIAKELSENIVEKWKQLVQEHESTNPSNKRIREESENSSEDDKSLNRKIPKLALEHVEASTVRKPHVVEAPKKPTLGLGLSKEPPKIVKTVSMDKTSSSAFFDDLLGPQKPKSHTPLSSTRPSQVTKKFSTPSKPVVKTVDKPLDIDSILDQIQTNKKTSDDMDADNSDMEVTEARRSSTPGADTSSDRKRKSVSWAPEHELRQIRTFNFDPEEWTAFDSKNMQIPHEFGNARDLDRNEGWAVFRHSIRMEETIEWYDPWAIEFPADVVSVFNKLAESRNSEESRTQAAREREALAAVYLREEHIPQTPAEPDEECIDDDNNAKWIPLYEVEESRKFSETSGMDPSAVRLASETMTLVNEDRQRQHLGSMVASPIPDLGSLLGSIDLSKVDLSKIDTNLLSQFGNALGMPPQPSQQSTVSTIPNLDAAASLLQDPMLIQSLTNLFPGASVQTHQPGTAQHSSMDFEYDPSYGYDENGSHNWDGPRDRERSRERNSRWKGSRGNFRGQGGSGGSSGNSSGTSSNNSGGNSGGGGSTNGSDWRRATPCKFFRSGRCSKGTDCPFSHL